MVAVSEEQRQAIRSLDTRTAQIKEVIESFPGLGHDEISEIIDYGPGATSALLTNLNQKREVHRRRAKGSTTGYVYYPGPDPESGAGRKARGERPEAEKKSSTPRVKRAARKVVTAPAETTETPTGPETTFEKATDENTTITAVAPVPSITQLPSVPPGTRRRSVSPRVDVAGWNQQAKERAERERAEREQAEREQAEREQAEHEQEVNADARFADSHVYVAEDEDELPQVDTPATAITSQQPAVVPMPQPVAQSASPEIGSAIASLMQAIDGLAQSYTDQIADEISTRVASAMDERLTNAIRLKITAKVEEKVSAILANNNFDTIAQQAVLPRLLIVGLLPDQERMIEKEFDGCFRLRFWKAGPGKGLTDLAANSDYVMTFVNKMSHSEEDSVKVAGKRPIRVAGGMSSLRAALTNLYVEGQKALKSLGSNEESAGSAPVTT